MSSDSGARGYAVHLGKSKGVQAYAAFAEAVHEAAEEQRLALPLSSGARVIRGPFDSRLVGTMYALGSQA